MRLISKRNKSHGSRAVGARIHIIIKLHLAPPFSFVTQVGWERSGSYLGSQLPTERADWRTLLKFMPQDRIQ